MKDYKKILEGVVNIINTTEKSDIGFSDICAFIGENCPELKESEDERIRKTMSLEKQGEPKQEENDQKSEPFRIKKGKWYVCIHDFCHNGIRIGEIIQAEHDNTIRGIGFLYMENKYFRPAFENEIPQKPKWTEEDKEQCDLLIEQLATLKRTLALDFRNEIKWLKSLKQRMEEQQWQRK